jgi:hypothetical protein
MKKAAKKQIKETFLTFEGFMEAALTDEKMKKFAMMLNNNLYAFRVKKTLFEESTIDGKCMLYNDNIFDLPLAKTNEKKEILISNSILAIFDRYLLCEELIRKGDTITAFLVEHNDALYAAIKTNTTNDKKISSEEYLQIFSTAYNNTSDIILEHEINILINSNPALESITLTDGELN